MSSSRLPGPLCKFLGAFEIDTGTLCLDESPLPGPTGAHGRRVRRKQQLPRIYREHRGVVKNPMQYVTQRTYLNGQQHAECAELVKTLAGAPRTGSYRDGDANWRRGETLNDRNVTSLEVGTAIATGWTADGFYPDEPTGQHSGIFAGAFKDPQNRVIGFTVVEQWKGLEKIQSRVVYFEPAAHGQTDDHFHRGRDYATIKW
jgi:hypothetical protein